MCLAGAQVKEGEKLDKSAVLKEVHMDRWKEQQELERRLVRASKQLDHLERAKREEEAPLLEVRGGWGGGWRRECRDGVARCRDVWGVHACMRVG